MTDKIYTIDEIKKIVTPLAQKYGMKRMYLFGSYARGEATPESDIDFRFDSEEIDSLLQLCNIKNTFNDVFNKDVDVIPTENLDLEIMFNICPEEVLIYG